MKLWKALDKAIKELKVTFKGVGRQYVITIEDDPDIVITQLDDNSHYQDKLRIDIRDWEKVKESIEELLEKEI